MAMSITQEHNEDIKDSKAEVDILSSPCHCHSRFVHSTWMYVFWIEDMFISNIFIKKTTSSRYSIVPVLSAPLHLSHPDMDVCVQYQGHDLNCVFFSLSNTSLFLRHALVVFGRWPSCQNTSGMVPAGAKRGSESRSRLAWIRLTVGLRSRQAVGGVDIKKDFVL